MKKGAIALLACVFALSLALVGCGGSADAKAAWVGTWDLYEMEEDGEVIGSDDIDLLRSLGMDMYLELNEDGTGSLVLFGESMDGTWEASSPTAGTFSIDGESVDMKIADDKLDMEQSGARRTFVAGEARANASDSASSASSAS